MIGIEFLGKKVVDVTSGFSGIAVAAYDSLSGMSQLSVQPFNESGSRLEDAYNIDLNSLDIVDDGYSSRVIKHNPDDLSGIKLGDKVEDIVTGETGTLTAVLIYMNGCTNCCISSRKEDNKKSECFYQSARLIKKLEDPSIEAKSGKSGGPSGVAARCI